ncbi:efflux RND transporter periplasmic adaptor subunit [soil metagenome]
MWKWLLLVFVLCVLMCGGVGTFFATSPPARSWFKLRVLQQKPTEVRVETLALGDLVRVVNAPGSIEPRTKVQISAQVIARITALPFREGDNVKKGDVVVKLDARELTAALQSAQAQLKGEEARLRGSDAAAAQAERDLARMAELVKADAETTANLEGATERQLRTQSAVEAGRHGVEAAKAFIVRASKDLENTTIVADFDGTITKLNAEVGELVVVGTLNNASSVIMEIDDLNTMIMKARLDESNVTPVAKGQRCAVYVNAFPNRTFTGSVERVGLKRLIDRDGTGYFEVEILVDKPADVLFASGLTANVDITVQRLPNVLRAPSQGIVDRKFDDLPANLLTDPLLPVGKSIAQVVFTIEGGKARAHIVKTGASDITHTVIEAGRAPGTRMVTGPFKVLATIKDGDDVQEEATPKPTTTPTPTTTSTPPTP